MATDSAGRVVRHLSALYFIPKVNPDGQPAMLIKTAVRGEVIDTSKLAPGESERLEELGAFLPEGCEPEDVIREQEALSDVYRGQRGDQEALSRANQRAGTAVTQGPDGGIVDVSGQGQSEPAPEGGAKLADFITDRKLTVDDTVALAGDDPAKAKRVLEAERLASGGSPRAGVESRLQKLIDGE
jgi:hypothetical protein